MKQLLDKYSLSAIRNLSGLVESEKDLISSDLFEKFSNGEIPEYARRENYHEFKGPFWEGNEYLVSLTEKDFNIIYEIGYDFMNVKDAVCKIKIEDFLIILKTENIIDILNDYLDNYIYPIGTVVTLKGEKNKDKNKQLYMITDRFILRDEDSKEYYEYKANIYPFGSLPDGKGMIFNGEDIAGVKFIGYETEDDKKLVENVKEELDKRGIEKINIENHKNDMTK